MKSPLTKLLFAASAAAGLWAWPQPSAAQDAGGNDELLKRLEQELLRLQEANKKQQEEISRLSQRFHEPGPGLRPEAPAPAPVPPAEPAPADIFITERRVRQMLRESFQDPEVTAPLRSSLTLEAGYKKDLDYQGSGFYIRGGNDFLLVLEGRGQFRYTYYNQLDKGTQNGAPVKGVNRDVRSDFEFNRILLDAGGFIFTPNLTYRLQPIISTDFNDAVVLNQAFLNWNVLAPNKDIPLFWRHALQVRAGQYLTSFGRWENNGNAWGGQIPTDHQLLDRPIAVQFFKPDRTLGVELHGVLGGVREGLPEDRPGTSGTFQYQLTLSNSFNAGGDRYGLDQGLPRQTDKYPALIARGLFDVLKGRYEGEDGKDYYLFGRNQSDLEHHLTPALQVGGSVGWDRIRGQRNPPDNPQLGFLYRRADDSDAPSDRPGSDNIRTGFDAAFKYRGFSGFGELYYSSLNGLYNDSPTARNQDQDALGFYVSAGQFVVPHTLELFAGTSAIFAGRRPFVEGGPRATGADGRFPGDNWQFSFGTNYFPFHTQKMKLTLAATHLRDPAVGSSAANFVQSSSESAWQIAGQVQFGF